MEARCKECDIIAHPCIFMFLILQSWQENASREFMSVQLEHMNVRLNAYTNIKVGSSNYPKPKPFINVEF